jgi:hypothetical protein
MILRFDIITPIRVLSYFENTWIQTQMTLQTLLTSDFSYADTIQMSSGMYSEMLKLHIVKYNNYI